MPWPNGCYSSSQLRHRRTTCLSSPHDPIATSCPAPVLGGDLKPKICEGWRKNAVALWRRDLFGPRQGPLQIGGRETFLSSLPRSSCPSLLFLYAVASVASIYLLLLAVFDLPVRTARRVLHHNAAVSVGPYGLRLDLVPPAPYLPPCCMLHSVSLPAELLRN